MKTTLLSIIGLLLMGELMAGHTKVTFFSRRGEAFILVVNGQRINQQPATRVYLDNLYPGRNRIKMRIFKRGRVAEIRRPVYIDEGYATDFAISGNHRYGFRLEKVATSPIYYGRRHGRYEYDDYGHGRHYGKGHRNGRGRGKYHGRYREPAAYHHIDYVNMEGLMVSLRYYPFDREKLAYAKSAISGKVLYTSDVISILNEFTFDNAKLDFAEFAYQFTADKENFYRVKKTFTFRSSIRKLDERLHY